MSDDRRDGSDDDQVGYRRPPKGTRFTKGRSGNPSGRPKGVEPGLNSFEQHLSRLVPVKINGVSRRISIKEALEMKVVESSATLPPHALLKLLKELDVEIVRSREVEAKRAMRRASAMVQQCVDCKEIVDAFIALGLVTLEDEVRRVVPMQLYKLIERNTLEADARPEIVNLRRFYWPGSTPNRPAQGDD